MEKEITLESILPSVFVVRGVKAMIDSDLAALYGVLTKRKRQRISLLELVPVVCSKVTVPQSSQQYLLTLCV